MLTLDKQILLLVFVFLYGSMLILLALIVFKSRYIRKQSEKRFMPAIGRYLDDGVDLSPKLFFDLAEGCGLNRATAVNNIKKLLTEAGNSTELLRIERLVNSVEDYAPIQTQKAGLLASLNALEAAVKSDGNLSQHLIAIKNEMSSLSEKFAEFEINRKFNKFVAWLSVFGFIFGSVGLFYSITSPTADQIAASILKIQSVQPKS